MKFSFFKGCFIPIRQPHIEKISKPVLNQIGIEIEDEEFSCCPEPVGVSITHKNTGLAIAARNLCLAERKEHPILTICNGCTYTLKNTIHELEKKETKQSINKVLADFQLKYEGKIQVKHLAQVIEQDIGLYRLKRYITTPLTTLKTASHTGCHILSPPEIMDFDDPQHPKKLDRLVEVLGAKSLDYANKTQCCGWTLSNFGERKGANKLLADKLKAMHHEKADFITVICPQCLSQFDTGQLLASRSLKLDFKIPVLHYIQVLGLALGYSLEDIGYYKHRVKSDDFETKIRSLQT